MLAIHPCTTLPMLSENEINPKYDTTGLADHKEPFTDDIEGVEVVENCVCKYFRRAPKVDQESYL